MEMTAPKAGGKDLWEKFCKIETTRGLMSTMIYALHFSGDTAGPYIKERLQKSSTSVFCIGDVEIISSLWPGIADTCSVICELFSSEQQQICITKLYQDQ